MQKSYNKKRKLNKLKASLLLLMMVCFAGAAMAQDVLMKTGSMTLNSDRTVMFYDSQGPSEASNAAGGVMIVNYWDKWYTSNENFTYTFNAPADAQYITVSFEDFTAYAWSNEGDYQSNPPLPPYNCASIGDDWNLRINNDYLYVYEGPVVDPDKLIGVYTGNTKQDFAVTATGAITFRFVSDGQFQEEGWGAKVTCSDEFKPQAPFMRRSSCADQITLTTTTLGAKIYYTTGGNLPDPRDPLQGTTLYDPNDPIIWGAGNLQVNAIAVVGEGSDMVSSDVTTMIFTDADRMPDLTTDNFKPTIERVGTENKVKIHCPSVPSGFNETFFVTYTYSTDGSNPVEPTRTNGTRVYFTYITLEDPNNPDVVYYSGNDRDYVFEWTTPGTKFRAKMFAWSCNQLASQEASPLTFGTVKVDAPTINLDDNTGAVTLTMSNANFSSAKIYYTTDGSEPTNSSTLYTTSSNITLTAGQTIKAIAYMEGDGYQKSDVVSKIYIPGGQSSGGGVYGDVVLLNDLEEHTLSYYSDGSQPIHSLNPADVKITYYGNSPAGRTTMTTASENGDTPTSFSATASDVAVNVGESANQFIYLKTLENADPEGTGTSYPYTMIPNPFQVRPTGESGTGTTTYISYDRLSSSSNVNLTDGTYLLVYESGNYAFDGTISNGNGGRTSVSISNGVISDPGSAALLTLVQAATSGGTTYYYLKGGDYYYGSDGNGNLVRNTTGNTTSYQWSVSVSNGTLSMTNRGQSPRHMVYSSTWYFYPGQSSVSNNLSLYMATEHTTQTTIPGWRGFYAWRVKSLSSGLTIQDKESKATYGVDDIIYADQEVEFATDKQKGNEVEFEALWAQAYLTTGTTSMSTYVSNGTGNYANYKNAYERNFHVSTSLPTHGTYPYTVTTINPDGTGTSGTVTLSSDYTCSNDVKFENMTLSAGQRTITGAGYNLVFGRGIEGSVETVRGLQGGSTAEYTIRIESGLYKNVYLGSDMTVRSFSGKLTTKGVIGNDYDRANGNNDDLSISPLTFAGNVYGCGYARFSNSTNKDNLTFDWYIKSGKVHDGILGSGDGGDQSIYIGSGQSATNGNNSTTLQYAGKRRITIEGGEMSSIAGGMNSGYFAGSGQNIQTNYQNDYTDYTAKDNVTIRMKGGTVNGAIYGAAAFAGASGGRTFVITGGDVLGWIAGGCNGTHTDGGELYGNSYIYVGGKANVGNSSGGNHIGGVVRYQEQNVGTYYYGTNGADGGNIFGAGCGILPGSYSGSYPNGTFTPNTNYQLDSYTVGRVNNSTVVIADNATIWSDVYGGGNYGYIRTDGSSSINVLGGTIKGNVYGGANKNKGQTVNINMKDGEVVNNIYGGSNSWGVIKTAATVTVSGGKVKNVFGGGYGADTDMGTSSTNVNVQVNIAGNAEVTNNVYGGGEEGEVYGNTFVNVSGGTMKAVFGAGKGSTDQKANIAGNTTVNVSGGEITGKKEGSVTIGSVFGGGELGTVAYNANNATSDHTSTVSVSGGTLTGSVFGGGQLGTTQGKTILNISGGQINGSVFGGAYGVEKTVYVAGSHTVNVMATDATTIPYIVGSVYGGSRLANDGKQLGISHDSFNNSTEPELSSVINISGGRIREHVYAAGYYGRCFGSVYVNIGADAVENAPYNTTYKAKQQGTLFIQGSVWAGGDWGVFDGDFGDPTITGKSSIYVDGAGYVWSNIYTDANYMNLGASILGCGTSCEAGKGERMLVIRNYGSYNVDAGNTINPVSSTSRSFNSFQRFTDVVIDNSHITFIGQGLVNDLNTTKKYSLYGIEGTSTAHGYVYLANGSTVIMNAPASDMRHFWSAKCEDTFDEDLAPASFTPVKYSDLRPNNNNGGYLDNTDNRIRVNGGSYVEVKYDETIVTGTAPNQNTETHTYFGELKGFAHMMVAGVQNPDDATCAYARPKKSTSSPVVGDDYQNTDDGGWLSYDGQYNSYDVNGGTVTSGGIQLPYENHAPTSKSDTEYFRVWRFGGHQHYVEGVITVQQHGDASDPETQKYYTVDVTVQLPAWRTSGSYYRFDRVGNTGAMNTLIDYGIDVMTFNAACYGESPIEPDPTAQPAIVGNWMYYNGSSQTTGAGSADCPEIGELNANPDVNYGLIIMPGDGMVSASNTTSNYIICSESDNWIAENMRYNCNDYMAMPTVTFRLTYRNDIKSNMEWDPITIPLVQCDAQGNIKEYVDVSLAINTITEITSGFNTQMYATMNGGTSNKNMVQGKIVLPTFDLEVPNTNSVFKVVKAVYTTQRGEGTTIENAVLLPNESPNTLTYAPAGITYGGNNFGLTIHAVQTPDNNDDWRNVPDTPIDGAPGDGSSMNELIGDAGGRSALALGFDLWFSNVPSVQDKSWMGTVTFTVEFSNYKYGTGTGVDKKGTFDVEVEIYRIGQGRNFYVDGIHGVDNQDNNRGRRPDIAAKTVDYVFNRLGFLPGDNLFVVNTVTISKALNWDASAHLQSNANIYRYPGNHELGTTEGIEDNENNTAFKGVLFKVDKLLSITDINIDGMYAEANATTHNTNIFPTPEGATLFNGQAQAPIFTISNGGRLNLKGATIVKNNCNDGSVPATANGGAISITDGGILAMNGKAEISGNINAVAGGVYMDGSMVVSDYARVYDNMNATAKAARQSNVWLTEGATEQDYKVVQIGLVDEAGYGQLIKEADNSAKIGIDKTYNSASHTIDDYLPVVYAETPNLNYLEEPYQTNAIIVHDKQKYELEKYYANKNYLYWLATWVSFQDHQPNHQIIDDVDEGGWDGLENIHTPQQLAWAISMVNKENGVTADNTSATINITADIDMGDHIWVPIGDVRNNTVFKGKFNGNGHVITGVYGGLEREDMGLFGRVDGANATIQDVIVNADFYGKNENVGAVVGTLTKGTLCNAEAAGKLENKDGNGNMGGLVGTNGGTIHSCFAVPVMKGGSHMGGLVGVNSGDLYNSYSNVDFSKVDNQETMVVSGLVATNTGNVENCYAEEGTHEGGTYYAFAEKNKVGESSGTIKYCYATAPTGNGTVNYVNENFTGTLSGHGTYGAVQPDIKHLEYMFYDNLIAANTNTYVGDEGITGYVGNHTPIWNGLLSALNQWVRGHEGYTSWNRPINSNVNGDLPVLAFPKDQSLATLNSDGKYLQYSTGLDNLLTSYTNPSGIFVYGAVTGVENVPASADVKVTVAEDAVLLQAADAEDFTATVGITFDNSGKDKGNHSTYNWIPLTYDWHFMSSSLQDAAIGATYNTAQSPFGGPVSLTGPLVNSYFPNGLPYATPSTGIKWDLYTYYEPQYHWINLKRNGNSHWHEDTGQHIDYVSGQAGLEQNVNETIFVPGKGYMMAISQDSYLNSTGTLNNANVPVTITSQEPLNPEYNKGWNLVGNPYQGYLDLDALFKDNADAKYAYVYDADINIYAPFVENASNNPNIIVQYVHPHQAFFVHSEAATATLTFKPSMAKATDNAPYFRGDDRVNYPLVNLFASNDKGNRDLAVIEFNRPELGGVTKVNGLRNANFQLAASLEGQRYGLVFTPEGTERVPVHFTTEENGTFTLTWETLHGDFTSLLLVDNMTGTITDMLRADHYTFDASKDDYASRFYLTYTVTGVDEYNEGDGSFAFFDGSEWVVNGKGQLDIVDVTGRVLFSKRLVNEQNRVSLNGVADGVYLMRVSDGKNTMVQKIVVR